jgi:hypothetical protein
MLNAERSFRRIKGYKQMPHFTSSTRYADTPTPTTEPSVPPPRVRMGSPLKIHANWDTLGGT